MKLYKTLKMVTISLTIFYLGLLFSQTTTPPCPDCVCEEPVNIWYKVSTEALTYGSILKLDMSKGQAYSDQMFIYIVVQDLDTKEIIYIAFPNGGDWVDQGQDPFYKELDKEFNDLEEYLKLQKDSQEIKKKQ